MALVPPLSPSLTFQDLSPGEISLFPFLSVFSWKHSVWSCRYSALCGQAIRTEIINTESSLPVSCWMKLEGIQLQKDFLAYHFWGTHSNSHLEGQLPASISDCSTALTRALRASLHVSRRCEPDLGCGALVPDRRRDQRGDQVLLWCSEFLWTQEEMWHGESLWFPAFHHLRAPSHVCPDLSPCRVDAGLMGTVTQAVLWCLSI